MKKLSSAQRAELFSRLLPTYAGRQRLAAFLTQPLRYERDYFSIARKLLLAEDLPDGVFPIYDKDPDVRAFFVGDTGMDIASVITPTNISVPLFEVVSNPKIPITQIQDRRYDVVTRTKDKGRSEINKKEDLRIFALVEAAAEDATNPNDIILVSGALASADLADGFGQIEQRDLIVTSVLVNPRDQVDFRKFDRDVYDPETQREVLKSGVLGDLWGAKVMQSSRVTVGKVFIIAEPETAGRIPVRSDIVVLPSDDPDNRMVGFSMFERIGATVHNIKAVQELAITRT